MTLPGGSGLSRAEIVRFIDLAAADIPGWVPSEHFDEHSLVQAYKDAQTGDDGVFKMITTDRFLTVMIMAGKRLLERYEASGKPFSATVEEVIGPDTARTVSAFLRMRGGMIAEQVIEWDNPEAQLGMYQLDSFLLGWLAHESRAELGDA